MAAIAFLIAALAGAGTASLPLTMVADVPLPGDTSRFDYESYDPVSRQIFVNVQSRRQLIQIDPSTDQVAARFDFTWSRSTRKRTLRISRSRI